MSPSHVAKALAFGLALSALGLAAQGLDFYSPGTEEDWTSEFSANRPYNVRSVPAPTRSGAEALRMEARYGERDDDGSYHSEIEKEAAGRPGETRWYGFSTYVPASWVDSEQVTVTAQWWSHSRANPPLSLRIQDDQWLILQRWTTGREGTMRQVVGPVRKGTWTDWVFQVSWSSGDGFVKVWRDGEVVFERRGPNIYPITRSLRFKLGVYVWPWKDAPPAPETSSPRILYHDEIRIGDENSGYEAVRPRDDAP